jgi:hypothetical protein
VRYLYTCGILREEWKEPRILAEFQEKACLRETMMPEISRMKLDSFQPIQLYLSSAKLDVVLSSAKRSRPLFAESIPVKRLGNQIVFVDGHTRAFAAFLLGFSAILVYWEYEELDWDEYEACVR